MKKIISLFLAVCVALPLFSQERGKIAIPDLKGYVTLKCDFHMHTIFSDGTVWPRIRIDEAYRDGLDAISITDHLEYPVCPQTIERLSGISLTNLSKNIAYEIVESFAKYKGIILIRGTEISQPMAPGHLNAIFLTDCDELANKSYYMDTFRAAKAQNAFIFWCHPGAQLFDTIIWYDAHTKLLEQGMMHGIEVVNDINYSPEAHRWALDKNLTMIGSTDVHDPMPPFAPGKYRTMTLVFARERTAEAIYEALMDRRTAIYYEGFIIGKEKYLKELFENAVEINVTKTDDITANITFNNKSDLSFHLKRLKSDAWWTNLRNTSLVPYTIKPQSVQTIQVKLNEGVTCGDVNFIVENCLVEPDKRMNYTVRIN